MNSIKRSVNCGALFVYSGGTGGGGGGGGGAAELRSP